MYFLTFQLQLPLTTWLWKVQQRPTERERERERVRVTKVEWASIRRRWRLVLETVGHGVLMSWMYTHLDDVSRSIRFRHSELASATVPLSGIEWWMPSTCGAAHKSLAVWAIRKARTYCKAFLWRSNTVYLEWKITSLQICSAFQWWLMMWYILGMCTTMPQMYNRSSSSTVADLIKSLGNNRWR